MADLDTADNTEHVPSHVILTENLPGSIVRKSLFYTYKKKLCSTSPIPYKLTRQPTLKLRNLP